MIDKAGKGVTVHYYDYSSSFRYGENERTFVGHLNGPLSSLISSPNADILLLQLNGYLAHHHDLTVKAKRPTLTVKTKNRRPIIVVPSSQSGHR
jgi:hypothetical protein